MKGATQVIGDDAWRRSVSIHAPNEGSDHESNGMDTQSRRFQSTLPMKGAMKGPTLSPQYRHVSIHAPNEGSDGVLNKFLVPMDVSIHAPNEGSDAAVQVKLPEFKRFNPRSQ